MRLPCPFCGLRDVAEFAYEGPFSGDPGGERPPLDAGPAETAEHARLTALLGRDGGIEDLTAALSERIRSGEIDLATPGLADHLWTTTLDKLAVDQPKFAPYRRVRTAETQEG